MPFEPSSNRHPSTIACANRRTISPASRPPVRTYADARARVKTQLPRGREGTHARAHARAHARTHAHTRAQQHKHEDILIRKAGKHLAKRARRSSPGYGSSTPFHMKTPNVICDFAPCVGWSMCQDAAASAGIQESARRRSAHAARALHASAQLTAQNRMAQMPLKKMRICGGK